jgi:hypothetical protein
VEEELARREEDVVFLDESRLFPGLDFIWELASGHSRGMVGLGDHRAALDEIDGVLARFSGFPVTAEEYRTPNGQYLCAEWHALARCYMRALPCPVVNRLKPELWYKASLSIPDLVSLAPCVKFGLPRVLVTTGPDDVRNFYDLCGRSVCYSPLTMTSNYIVNTEDGLRNLERLSELLPLNLRERVAGEHVEAYVVGPDVICDASDTAAMPDADVHQHCCEVAAALGVTFCQLHLVKTDAGEWYCEGLACMPDLLLCPDETRRTIVGQLTQTLLLGRETRP